MFQPYLKTFAAYYYNRGVEWKKQVAINFKEWEGYSFPQGSGVFDMERGQAADIRPDFWQTCTSVSKNSWGYVTNHQYKPVGELVDELVDIVSKNGTLLLNIGPKADGTIPEREQQILREIGAWLKINGEAIYGTRPWTTSGEGRDIRFTTAGDTLYALFMAWTAGDAVIAALAKGVGPAGTVEHVTLLGGPAELTFKQDAAGLHLTFPSEKSAGPVFAVRITGLHLNQRSE